MTAKLLTVEQLYKPAVADALPASTRRLKAFNDFLGQERAKEAVLMALEMPHCHGSFLLTEHTILIARHRLNKAILRFQAMIVVIEKKHRLNHHYRRILLNILFSQKAEKLSTD